MSITKLTAIIAERTEKIISEMDTEVEAIKEEEFLRKVPEIASLSDAAIRGYAVIIARARKQGWNEAFRFMLNTMAELED